MIHFFSRHSFVFYRPSEQTRPFVIARRPLGQRSNLLPQPRSSRRCASQDDVYKSRHCEAAVVFIYRHCEGVKRLWQSPSNKRHPFLRPLN